MKLKTIYCQILLIFIARSIFCQSSQGPGRPAWLGIFGHITEAGLSVDSVSATGTGATLQPEDILMAINQVSIRSMADVRLSMKGLRSGDSITIMYERGTMVHSGTFAAAPLPMVTMEGVQVDYGWVTFKKGKLRSITYTPTGTTDKVPFVFLIPGFNCSSIETFHNSYNGRFIRQLTDAGIGVFTVEKSGVGESFGCAPCDQVDMQTDIATFTAGYEALQRIPRADTSRLFIFGHSMGGVIAPVIASRVHPAGVIVFATVFRPWSEFLLEMHRIQAPLEGMSYAETEQYVRNCQKVYFEFFVNKKSPAAIALMPDMYKLATEVLDYAPDTDIMWTRHWKFWQQIDSLDLATEWSAVQCPVLSVFGGADYIACSELEHLLLTRAINSSHPGQAIHLTIPDIDHIMIRHPDMKSSYQSISSGRVNLDDFHTGLGNALLTWMRSSANK